MRSSISRVVFSIAFLTSLQACSGNVGSIPSASQSFATRDISYTALGASDAVGSGATIACALPNSTTFLVDPTCSEPGASNYVADIRNYYEARGDAVSLDDMGISGAVLGPDIASLYATYGVPGESVPCTPEALGGIRPDDFLDAEAPAVHAKQSIITIFAGGNDLAYLLQAMQCGAGGTTVATQHAFVQQWIGNFGRDLEKLVLILRAVDPTASIAIANLPNAADIPIFRSQPASVRETLQALSVGIDRGPIADLASQGVAIVDLLCDPNFYADDVYAADGFHPSDTGYALLAAGFEQRLADKGGRPSTSCPNDSASLGTNDPIVVLPRRS